MAKVRIKNELFKEQPEKKNEIAAILLFAVSIFIFVSLISFNNNDLSIFTSEVNRPACNFAGIVGAYAGVVLLMTMGLSAYAIPLLILFWSVARFAGAKVENYILKIFGTIFLILAASSIFSMVSGTELDVRFRMGGVVGVMFSNFLVKYLGTVGAMVVVGVLMALS
ncbi:MAG: DNA translocase FtsK 4TM domain-containing protein, partial [Candidatus Omnitrophota bacterium]